MRIAVFSDIHGNSTALDIVLSDAKVSGVDAYLCLGDVAATGPQPGAVIDRVGDVGCPTIMGNADDELLSTDFPETDDPDMRNFYEIDRWCLAQLSPMNLDALRDYVPTASCADGALLGFHGSPASFNEVIAPGVTEADLAKTFHQDDVVVFAGGHTHLQTLRRFGASYYLNPGSVGMSYARTSGDVKVAPVAEYAIVELTRGELRGADLRRLPYSPEPVFRAARETGMPHAEWWIGNWRGVPSTAVELSSLREGRRVR